MQSLFTLSVTKCLHFMLKCCSIWVLHRYSETLTLPLTLMKEMLHELLYHPNYSMENVSVEIKNFCCQEKFINVYPDLCVCFPSLNCLPKPVAKCFFEAYVMREFELYFIQSLMWNDEGFLHMYNLTDEFMSKFNTSAKISSVLKHQMLEFIFQSECRDMRSTYILYFETEQNDIDYDSDSSNASDDNPPGLVGYGDFPDSDSDEEFGKLVRDWSTSYVYF